MFITVIEFKLDTNSRRSFRSEVSVLAAGWALLGSAAATWVSEAGTGLWSVVVAVSMSFRISLVTVRLPGVVS